jgi:hypothetical protein
MSAWIVNALIFSTAEVNTSEVLRYNIYIYDSVLIVAVVRLIQSQRINIWFSKVQYISLQHNYTDTDMTFFVGVRYRCFLKRAESKGNQGYNIHAYLGNRLSSSRTPPPSHPLPTPLPTPPPPSRFVLVSAPNG